MTDMSEFNNSSYKDDVIFKKKITLRDKIKRHLPGEKKKLVTFIVIALAVPVTISLALVSQEVRSRASGPEIASIAINPGSINSQVGGGNQPMSALAYDSSGEPVYSGVTYEWSMSSTDTVGTLSKELGEINEFKPLKVGCGQLTVIANKDGKTITKSTVVAVADSNGKSSECAPKSTNNYGQALSITSSNNAYVRAVNSGSIGNFNSLTIEALAYYVPMSTNIDYPIVSKKWNISAGERMPFYLNITKDGHLSFIYTVQYQGGWSNTELISKSVLSSNTFHHIAVVYDGTGYGTLSLYIDGYRDVSTPLTGTIAGGSNGDVIIGWQSSTKFNGEIDEVRISNIPRYFGDHYDTQTEPFINDAATLLLYKFDNNINDTTGKTVGAAEAGTVSFANSVSSPFVYPVTDHYTLTPSEENVTMPVSTPNSSYGIYGILKNNGEIVKDQSNFEYHWLPGDLVNLQPFSACTNGIVEPCPMDHASLTAQNPGSTLITLVVAKKGTTERIASTNFNISVVKSPENTPTPTVTPVPTPITVTTTLTPLADAFVKSSNPTTNYGKYAVLETNTSPNEISYMKFNLSQFAGRKILSAKLLIKVSDPSTFVQALRRMDDSLWTETKITYNLRPKQVALIKNFTASKKLEIIEIDVTKLITAKSGTAVTFGITSSGSDKAAFYAREVEPASRPKLIIKYQ